MYINSYVVYEHGELLGYVVSEFEEDLGSMQRAVDTACGLFCIQHGLVDEKGDPVIKAPRMAGGYEDQISGVDSMNNN